MDMNSSLKSLYKRLEACLDSQGLALKEHVSQDSEDFIARTTGHTGIRRDLGANIHHTVATD